MKIVALSEVELQAMLEKAALLAVSTYAATNEKSKIKTKMKTKVEGEKEPIDIDTEIDNWITLHEAWDFMKIKKNRWYSKYRNVIRHKTYGTDVWVYKPSIYSFFVKDNINGIKRT